MSVHAPYNFVTLSRFVHEPDWWDQVSHDIPFQDGLSGSFEIEIKAHSKILIGGKRGQQQIRGGHNVQVVHPYRLPDNSYAIPERSLRGMIRNVIEIAAFGRMKFADDKRYGVRDLKDTARPFYRDRIVGKVNSGWLWLDENSLWRISPCEFARLPFSLLEEFSQDATFDWTARSNPRKQKDVPCRYKALGSSNIEQSFNIVNGKCTTGSNQKGRIVLTGNTGIRGNKAKKAEFFFYDDKLDDEALIVPQAVFDAFKDIHEPDDGRPTNPGWMYWKKKIGKERIPVFYITDSDDNVESFGLAMMFKLAHSRTIGEMIEQASPRHIDDNVIDLTTLLFGVEANQEKTKQGENRKLKGLKARVNMGLAKCISDVQPIDEPVTILAGPKASYYPSYVRQPTEGNGRLKGRTYATYTPVETASEKAVRCPEIRGWKRYPAGRADTVTPATNNPNHKVKVFLKPLPSETKFTSTVRFHNLRPVELGALLWALEWGGDENLYHRIGMAKPYGYGQIGIKVKEADWRLVPNDPTLEEKWTKEKLIEAFTDHMEQVFSTEANGDCGWHNSEQITQLLAMADPAKGRQKDRNKELDYMVLEMKRGNNDFQNAKNARQVLAPYISVSSSCSDHRLWERDCAPSVQTDTHVQQQRPQQHQPRQGGNFLFRTGDIVIVNDDWQARVLKDVRSTDSRMNVEADDDIEPVNVSSCKLKEE